MNLFIVMLLLLLCMLMWPSECSLLPSRLSPVILASRESNLIDAAFAIEEAGLKVLDLVDSSVTKAWDWTTHHREVIKAVAALSVSGLHKIIHNLEDLGERYRDARNILKQVDPELKKAKGEILDSVLALEHLATEIVKAKADPSKFAEVVSLQAAYGQLLAAQNRAKKMSTSLSEIQHAVDPEHLQKLFQQLYLSSLTALAAVKSQAAATITVGVNIGNIFYNIERQLFYEWQEHQGFTGLKKSIDTNSDGKISADEVATATVGMLKKTVSRIDSNADGKITPDEVAAALAQSAAKLSEKPERRIEDESAKAAATRERIRQAAAAAGLSPEGVEQLHSLVQANIKWMDGHARTLANIGGIFLAYKFREVGLTVAACATGSSLIVQAVEKSLNPFLKSVGFDEVQLTGDKLAGLHTSLIVLGVYSQLRPGVAAVRMPLPVKIALGPFLALEKELARLVKAKGVQSVIADAIKK